MRLWRLSSTPYAGSFDGGYGLFFEGRWNSVGRAVTYCGSSPSLCILEKLVHVEDPALLPPLTMIAYEAPVELGLERIRLDDLPSDWRRRQTLTQRLGDEWWAGRTAAILQMPSALVAFADAPDCSFMINHSHPDAARIAISSMRPFEFDPRLLAP